MTNSSAPSARPSLDAFVLGCSQLGGLYKSMSDEEAQDLLETAWERGIRHFDTAPHYGSGLSERRLGRFLAQLPRDEFTVSTKVGRLLVETSDDVEGEYSFFGGDRRRRVLDYSADGVRRSLEESLARLGLDRIDTLYVHDPEGPHLREALESGFAGLRDLQHEGTVRHVGVGTTDVEAFARFVDESDMDVAMFAGRYTLLDRSGAAALDRCAIRGVCVVAAGVYNSGLLAAPRRDAHFDYGPAPDEMVEAAFRLQAHCAGQGIPLRAAAAQFVLRHPAVRQVAFGCRTPAQVRDNLTMLLHPIPEGFWDGFERNPAGGGRSAVR